MKVLLLLAGFFAYAAAHTCPPLWTGGTHGCYRYMSTPKNWQDARTHCMGFTACGGSGVGDLAVITNQAANDFIKLLREGSVLASPAASVWLGGTDRPLQPPRPGTRPVQPVWRWANGLPFLYTNWAVGQPNNQGGNEDCLRFPSAQSVHMWDDFDCMMELPYICHLYEDPFAGQQPGGQPGTGAGQQPRFLYGQPQQAQIGGHGHN